MDESCFYSGLPAFVGEVLRRFNEKDTLRFFESLGVMPRSKNGYVYPRSEQASSIREALIRELEAYRVEVQTDAPVLDWEKKGEAFFLKTPREEIQAKKVILTTGGGAMPKTGSNGSGYMLARKIGHQVVPSFPALVALHVRENEIRLAAGVRIQAKVSLWIQGEFIAEETGEVQITDYGLSGIPVFQISRHASLALQQGKKVKVQLVFMPEMPKGEAISWWKTRKKRHPNWTERELLLGVIPDKLISLCLKKGEKDIFTNLKAMRFTVVGTNGFDQAQVSGGGVKLDEVDPSRMESRKIPGLYFAGEILDVDGICGGYNLQWAWSSGVLAGTHAATNRGTKKERKKME